MPELETQAGQIFISSKRLSKGFISLFSEKIQETNSEIYFIMEIAPGSQASPGVFDRIAKNIENILKRNFSRENPNNFENSIAQINDYLAKLAAGSEEVTWFGHMNSCVSARQNENLYISTCGKMHAYLFRDKQFSDIADSSPKPNPLKIFENFAAGKIKKKDYLILSTSQLFNYLSIERLQKILGELPINAACQVIVDLVKELADDSISFGTLVLEFNEGPALESEKIMNIAALSGSQSFMQKTKSVLGASANAIRKFIKHTVLLSKEQRMPNINLPKINAALIKEQAKKYTDLQRIKNLPKAKKFFFAAGAVFVILFILNIGVTVYVRNKAQAAKALQQKMTDVQNKIDGANTAYVFKDQGKAVTLTNEAEQELKGIPSNASINSQKGKLQSEIDQLQNLIEHIQNITATKLFSVNSRANALLLANGDLFAADIKAGLFTPFNLKTQSMGQNFTLQIPEMADIGSINGIFIAEDSQGNLYAINPSAQTAVQQKGALTANDSGMAFYGAPTKVYAMDKSQNQIISTPLSGGKDIPYFRSSENLGNALDFAIGGPIYLLTTEGIQKYVGGRQEPFASSGMTFSAGAKIYATTATNFIYVLDPNLKRIIVFDKQGNIIKQYESDQLQNPQNFAIDEQKQSAYILDGQNIWLLKMQ